MSDNITDFALRGAFKPAETPSATPIAISTDPTVNEFYRRFQAMQLAVESRMAHQPGSPGLIALAKEIDDFFKNG